MLSGHCGAVRVRRQRRGRDLPTVAGSAPDGEASAVAHRDKDSPCLRVNLNTHTTPFGGSDDTLRPLYTAALAEQSTDQVLRNLLRRADDNAPGDLYASERRDANRLSRRWQRGMHRAAAAFAAGDPGAAHRLAAEARHVRCVLEQSGWGAGPWPGSCQGLEWCSVLHVPGRHRPSFCWAESAFVELSQQHVSRCPTCGSLHCPVHLCTH